MSERGIAIHTYCKILKKKCCHNIGAKLRLKIPQNKIPIVEYEKLMMSCTLCLNQESSLGIANYLLNFSDAYAWFSTVTMFTVSCPACCVIGGEISS